MHVKLQRHIANVFIMCRISGSNGGEHDVCLLPTCDYLHTIFKFKFLNDIYKSAYFPLQNRIIIFWLKTQHTTVSKAILMSSNCIIRYHYYLSSCYLFHECPNSEHHFFGIFHIYCWIVLHPKRVTYYIIIVLFIPNGTTHAVVPNQEVLSILMHLY